jgi:hypothetical protein
MKFILIQIKEKSHQKNFTLKIVINTMNLSNKKILKHHYIQMIIAPIITIIAIKLLIRYIFLLNKIITFNVIPNTYFS